MANLDQNYNLNNNLKEEIEIQISDENFKFPWEKLLGFLLVLLILGAALIGYLFYKPEAPDINISFEKPQEILAGESFDFSVIISNNSSKSLNSLKLNLILPDEISFLEDDPSKKMAEIDLGDLAPASFHKENFKLIALSNDLSVKTIQANFKYKIEGSNIIFDSNSQIDLNIEKSAFNIFVDAPQNVFGSQKFKMTIKYQNNSSRDLEDVYLKVDFPPFYKFIESSIKNEDNLWNLGLIKSGQSGSIDLYGELIGKENQNVNFLITALIKINNKFYSLENQSYIVAISNPPLSLNILLNDSENYIASIGDQLVYVFQYKNNSNIPLENITLKAKFDSNLFDFSTAETNAYFDSSNSTFIWNSAVVPDFKNLASGQSGSVILRIKLKNNFDIKQANNDKNFVLKVNAQIESTTIPPGISNSQNISYFNYETKVRGLIQFNVFGLYRDPQWQIINKGPYPPKVNTLTQYTIHWQIKNYATDLSNVKISGVVYPGINFTGITKSNIGILPKFDKNSNLVYIEIPKILANKGVLDNPVEIVFQVEAIPSLNQVGENITLIDDIKLEATDDFTGEEVNLSLYKIDTSLPNDATIKISDRRVQQ